MPEIAYDVNATILFGTNTFLKGYSKFAHPYDFYSLRYVFAGAEKLQDEVRNTWSEKYGIRIFEGYGATETSPVLSINTPMASKKGSVGQLLPKLESQLQPVPGIDDGGRLFVKGPNVMLGYLKHDNPGVIEPTECEVGKGWYDTGDIVTIDGEDARDFDDAVYTCKRPSGGWCLYVAIADVSHYIPPASALDQEAHRRATSVYFPGRVIPMLPEALSNDLCSLNPQVDRLVMVCEMIISTAGQLSNYRFYEGVIQSHARLTYNQVSAMLNLSDERCQSLRQQYVGVIANIDELQRLYGMLRLARIKRGAIDFATTEMQIVFSTERKIDEIVPVQRNDAHRLIEECMLCANVSTADFLQQLDLPALYRVHTTPKLAKLETLRNFLGEMGLSLAGGIYPQSTDYQDLLSGIRGRHDAKLVETVMLRSLSQATYTPINKGHFGLAYQAYAHFTSPIRRYPDLLVHRAIRSVIQSNRKTNLITRIPTTQTSPLQATYPYDMAAMKQLGEHCSMAERRADEATWDVIGWLKCEYMQTHVGNQFPGNITAVTNFGLFVEINDMHVEGLIHISALPSDYYHFDAARHLLQGERSGRNFRLGDAVQVQVIRVDLDDKKIDFELVERGSNNHTTNKHRKS